MVGVVIGSVSNNSVNHVFLFRNVLAVRIIICILLAITRVIYIPSTLYLWLCVIIVDTGVSSCRFATNLDVPSGEVVEVGLFIDRITSRY